MELRQPWYAPLILPGELTRGTLVGGKFRILAKLGEGGMGAVYEGEHADLGQRVAIKVILGGDMSEEMMKRFRREAIVLAQLESEHVVRVMDYGALPDGSPYLVMEFLRGTDLQAYLTEHGPLAVEEVAEIGVAVCDALVDAHGKGIVHRDLKPSNIFLADRSNGRRFVKVLDFGLSLFRKDDGEAITQTHAVLGTPLYAAPEQFTASRDADARADIWALGASLYELATGTVPFPASSLAELATRLREGARPASSVNRAVPEALSNVFAKCLQRKLTDRYASALELRRDLKAFRAPFGKSSALFGAGMTENERAAFAVTEEVERPKLPQNALEKTEPHLPLGAVAIDDNQRTPKMVLGKREGRGAFRVWYVLVGSALLAGLAIGAALFVRRGTPPKSTGSDLGPSTTMTLATTVEPAITAEPPPPASATASVSPTASAVVSGVVSADSVQSTTKTATSAPPLKPPPLPPVPTSAGLPKVVPATTAAPPASTGGYKKPVPTTRK